MDREQRIAQLTRRLKFFRHKYHEADCGQLTSQLQRNHAIGFLLQMIDGMEPEKAKEEAREWLVKMYKSETSYQIMSALHNRIIPQTMARINAEQDEEWPTEIGEL